MKKSSVLFILLVIGISLYGQTDSIEKVELYNTVLSKKIKPEEFSKIAKEWKETIAKINKYPELPLDQNGHPYYSFVAEFKDLTKDKLFNRSLEWLSINYKLFPSYLYSNIEDGKIIYSISFDLKNNHTCDYIGVISIKNEKILIEFARIEYQKFIPGHYYGDTWIPDQTIQFGVKEIFPVILKKPSEWLLYLNMLKTTNEHFYDEANNLSDYINNYDSSYQF